MLGLGTFTRVAREVRADLTAAQDRDPAARSVGRAEGGVAPAMRRRGDLAGGHRRRFHGAKRRKGRGHTDPKCDVQLSRLAGNGLVDEHVLPVEVHGTGPRSGVHLVHVPPERASHCANWEARVDRRDLAWGGTLHRDDVLGRVWHPVL